MATSNVVFAISMVLALLTRSTVVFAVTCQDGVQSIIPCMPFLLGGGSNQASSQCCASAQNLNSEVSSTADRRALCQCFKDAVKATNIDNARAEELPKMCHINLGFDITPDIDCTK
uniref:Non-specific lipid-transfer protein n=1 Tax=Kalanchoe fedtschenkoi TaxID=63787 RepID=A0A7N0TP35_KALFE